MTFYSKIPDMECLSGDTLPEFEVEVEVGDGGDLSGCSMQVIVAEFDQPQTAVICKDCTPTETGFSVTLTSEDTSKLKEKTYDIHFRLVDQAGNSYRKLFGTLYVHTAARGT